MKRRFMGRRERQTTRKTERRLDGQGENADANCDVFRLFWHGSVKFQVRTLSLKKKEKDIGIERQGGKRSINNGNWILWGNSWWDVQWPKGSLFTSGQGASHGPAAFILLEVDGWSVFIFIMQMEEEKSWPYQFTTLTIFENQSCGSFHEPFKKNVWCWSKEKRKRETDKTVWMLWFHRNSEVRPNSAGGDYPFEKNK